MNADAKTAAESVFRQESGRILATLIRFSGSFDRAEEAMQEAFSAALMAWPEKGIRQNPAAWITTAAHRKVIDQSRREKTFPSRNATNLVSSAKFFRARLAQSRFDGTLFCFQSGG